MAFTYDVTTTTGKIRLLIPDNRSASAVFEDAEIEAFYALEGDSVYKGAALALETIAADHALTLKVVQVQDVKVDGRASAEALLKRAARLREIAEKYEDEASTELGFAIVEQARTEFQAQGILEGRLLTGDLD